MLCVMQSSSVPKRSRPCPPPQSLKPERLTVGTAVWGLFRLILLLSTMNSNFFFPWLHASFFTKADTFCGPDGPQFISSPTEWYLGCQILSGMSEQVAAAVNIHVRLLGWTRVSSSFQ